MGGKVCPSRVHQGRKGMNISICPSEFNGIVLNTEQEFIGDIICEAVAREEVFDLAAFQHYFHHEYISSVEEAIAYGARWREALSSKFPNFRFVIELNLEDCSTWYQATETSKTEDEETWESHPDSFVLKSKDSFNNKTGSDVVRRCNKCEASIEFTEPEVHSTHRGAKMWNCVKCGHSRIHSVRTIRERVNW